MDVVSQLVEAARLRYVEVSRPNVIVHTADTVRGLALDSLYSTTCRSSRILAQRLRGTMSNAKFEDLSTLSYSRKG